MTDTVAPVRTGARNGMPHTKPYRWNGDEAQRDLKIRERLAVLRADLADAQGIGPGPEWHRELAAEADAAPVPVPLIPPVLLVPEPAAQPKAAGVKCRRCRYLTTAIGHKITCGEGGSA